MMCYHALFVVQASSLNSYCGQFAKPSHRPMPHVSQSQPKSLILFGVVLSSFRWVECTGLGCSCFWL